MRAKLKTSKGYLLLDVLVFAVALIVSLWLVLTSTRPYLTGIWNVYGLYLTVEQLQLMLAAALVITGVFLGIIAYNLSLLDPIIERLSTKLSPIIDWVRARTTKK